MITVRQLQENIAEKGYHEVPFDVPLTQIKRAAEAYFDFLALPEGKKLKWALHLKVNETERGTEIGYWQRQSVTGFGYDDKEFFHYNAELLSRFRNHPEAPPELKALLDAAQPIYHAACQAAVNVLNVLEPVYPAIANLFSSRSVLRFLKYDRAPVGQFLAKGHYDRGGCSLAIAESGPGLRIGHQPEDVREVTHTPGKAIFFPALFMEQKTHGDFPASWHDVVQRTEDAFRPDAARWAIVFFAAPDEPSYFDRSMVHTARSPQS